jgi:hypothetical protein
MAEKWVKGRGSQHSGRFGSGASRPHRSPRRGGGVSSAGQVLDQGLIN